MDLLTDGKFIGRKSGQGKNGTWYQISVLSDGDTYTIRCSDVAYGQCANLALGDDVSIRLSLRIYNRDWIPRIEAINE